MDRFHTHGLEEPADSAITTAADHFKIGHIFEHLKAGQWTALFQTVHLSRIEKRLELAQDAGTLPTAWFRIDKHQERTRARLEINLKGHWRSWRSRLLIDQIQRGQ